MKHRDMRRRIAHEAARLIALDGSLDYGAAKRKAARTLGAPDSKALPDNQEIETALRSYQALYQAEEQSGHLALLRQMALEYMTKLAAFDPHLTGSVLQGTAGRHSDINLQLFADNPKDLEFFLLALGQAVAHGESRVGTTSFPRYRISDPRAMIDLVLYPLSELRQLRRTLPNGQPSRIRPPQLAQLLAGSANGLPIATP